MKPKITTEDTAHGEHGAAESETMRPERSDVPGRRKSGSEHTNCIWKAIAYTDETWTIGSRRNES